MHVAAQPIELGDDDRALAFACRVERAPKVRPPIECVGPLARLDLDERLTYDLKSVRLCEPHDRLALSVKPEP
jgi:hypothetical protein